MKFCTFLVPKTCPLCPATHVNWIVFEYNDLKIILSPRKLNQLRCRYSLNISCKVPDVIEIVKISLKVCPRTEFLTLISCYCPK